MVDTAAAPTQTEFEAAYAQALHRELPVNAELARQALRSIAAVDEVSMWRLGRGNGRRFSEAMLAVVALEQLGLVEVSPRRMPDQLRLTGAGVGYCEAHGIRVAERGPLGDISRPDAVTPVGDPLETAVVRPDRMGEARIRHFVETLYDRSDVALYRLKRASGEPLLEIIPVLVGLEKADLAVVVASSSSDRARLSPEGRAMVRGWHRAQAPAVELA